MARPKTIKENRIKTSVDITEDVSKQVRAIAKKKDRSVTWVINNLLKKALTIDCEKCKKFSELSGDK